jgi:hypothetical protein
MSYHPSYPNTTLPTAMAQPWHSPHAVPPNFPTYNGYPFHLPPDQTTDPLDMFHHNLLHHVGEHEGPKITYKGSPKLLPEIAPGYGWFSDGPQTFRYFPLEGRITDQNGVPILHVVHLTTGHIIHDLTTRAVVAKSFGYQKQHRWNLDTSSASVVLQKGNSFDLFVQTTAKTTPFYENLANTFHFNWGALLPPLDASYIVHTKTKQDIALVRNESEGTLNESYSMTTKGQHDILLLLLVLCHVADFVVEHCSEVERDTEQQKTKYHRQLVTLQKNINKWGIEPPPTIAAAPTHVPWSQPPFPARPHYYQTPPMIRPGVYASNPDIF